MYLKNHRILLDLNVYYMPVNTIQMIGCVQKRRERRQEIFKRAEKYAREYQIKEQAEIQAGRQARKYDNFYVPPAPKLAFVTRIRG
jgi:hypothetical protein